MKNIFKIVSISRPLHKWVAILAVLIVVTSLLELVTPVFSKFIVDEIVAQTQGQGGNQNRLFGLIAIGFVLGFMGVIFTAITERIGDHFAGKLRQFLTERFYHKVLTLPQSYFDSELSGKIINQLNRGIISIYNFINTSTNFILPIFIKFFLAPTNRRIITNN